MAYSQPDFGNAGLGPLNIQSGLNSTLNMYPEQQKTLAEGRATNALASGKELENKISKLNQLKDILSGVMNAPPQGKEAAYQYGLQQAKQLGIDVSTAPQHYDPNFVGMMGLQSDKGLAILQAQASIYQNTRKINLEQQTANAASGQAGARLALSGNAGAGNQILNQVNPSQIGVPPSPLTANFPRSMQMQGPGGQAGPGMAAPMQGQGMPQQQGPQGMPMAPQAPGAGNAQVMPPLQGPAELEAQKKQGENWANYKNEQSAGTDAANQMMPFIYSARDANNNMTIPTGPVVGEAAAFDPKGMQLNKDAANLQLAYLKTMKGIGNRVMATEFTALGQANPGTHVTKGVNNDILDQKEYLAKWGQMKSMIVQRLDSMGVRDPLVAENVATRIYQNIGGIDSTTGKPNLKALNDVPGELNNILKQGINSPTAMPQQYATSDGKAVSPEDYTEMKMKNKMDDADMMKKYDLKPIPYSEGKGPIPSGANINQVQQAPMAPQPQPVQAPNVGSMAYAPGAPATMPAGQ